MDENQENLDKANKLANEIYAVLGGCNVSTALNAVNSVIIAISKEVGGTKEETAEAFKVAIQNSWDAVGRKSNEEPAA